jgi:hypothetical protein
MKITVTAREILDAPSSTSWDDFCEKRGFNVWVINEGLMDPKEEFSISLEEARDYGLLEEDEE